MRVELRVEHLVLDGVDVPAHRLGTLRAALGEAFRDAVVSQVDGRASSASVRRLCGDVTLPRDVTEPVELAGAIAAAVAHSLPLTGGGEARG